MDSHRRPPTAGDVVIDLTGDDAPATGTGKQVDDEAAHEGLSLHDPWMTSDIPFPLDWSSNDPSYPLAFESEPPRLLHQPPTMAHHASHNVSSCLFKRLSISKTSVNPC